MRGSPVPGRRQPSTTKARVATLPAAAGTLAVLLLVTALVLLGVRGPGQAGLSATDDPAGTSGGAAAPSVAPGQAPAPAPSPTPDPVAMAIPDEATTPPPTGPVTPVVADEDTLVVPDGDVSRDTQSADAQPPPAAPPTTPPTTPVGPAQGDSPRDRFESQFPAHAAATQDIDDPASSRWAVLVGVNEHSGRTRDNVGSRQDAESLYSHLMDLGWQDDHVLLLTDAVATREVMIEAMHWLARKTDQDSVAVFSYSGHAKQWPGQDVDGDGEVTDEALWPSDNQHILDSEFVQLAAAVTAGHTWFNFMACEAAGFMDPGLVRDGRIVTFSSAEDEKSYEDPSVGHSVWGWNLTVRGLRHGLADANEDGEVTVQEAATYAIPRAAARTDGQAYGAQNGGMVDRAGGAFSLAIPTPPPPDETEDAAAPEDTGGDEDSSEGEDTGEPDPSPSPEPSSSPSDSCLLVICSSRD